MQVKMRLAQFPQTSSRIFDSSTLLFRLPPTLPPFLPPSGVRVILPSVSEGEGYVLSSIPRGT